MNRIPPKGHPVAMVSIPALGPTCGELAARAVGVEAGTLDDATVWAWLMGASEPGAYCPVAWREREGGMGRRMVIPGKERTNG